MAKLPSSLRMFGRTYRVRYVDPMLLEDADIGLGEMHYADGDIRIHERQTGKPLEKHVLIHEIIEAITYECGLEIDHPSLSTIAVGLHMIMADNPKLREFLLRR